MSLSCVKDNETYPPGNINNYAIGYQDSTGYSHNRTQKENPLMPEDEQYMRGWYSGIGTMLEGVQSAAQRRRPKGYHKAVEEWRALTKKMGWRFDNDLPL